MLVVDCFGLGSRNLARRNARRFHFRQAKVENLCVSTLGNKDVRRFDVPVDDAFSVSRVERIGNLDRERQNQLHLQRPSSNLLFQRDAVEKLHHDKGLSILLINFMDRADVRMIQCRSGPCLTLEPGQSLSVLGYFIRQEFQGNEPMQLHILGLVYDTHPTAAEFLDDAVMRNVLFEHRTEPCYGRGNGKSMRAKELNNQRRPDWRYIAITLIL
jgi:hypothetical protein